MRSDWSFDTVRTMSPLGTYRGTVNDLLPSAMVSEDNESFDDTKVYGSMDSEGTTMDGNPIMGVGVNPDAVHSTVIIKAPHCPDPMGAQDEAVSGTVLCLRSRPIQLNFILGAPPTYSGSVCSSRCAWYATHTFDRAGQY